jgi:hypothetical protein
MSCVSRNPKPSFLLTKKGNEVLSVKIMDFVNFVESIFETIGLSRHSFSYPLCLFRLEKLKDQLILFTISIKSSFNGYRKLT